MKHLRLVLRSILRGLTMAVGTDSTADGATVRAARRFSGFERGVALTFDRLEFVARTLAR